MNYLPIVSWGMCVGGTGAQQANLFSSWGLFVVSVVTVAKGACSAFSSFTIFLLDLVS
jgi:hypothetical protein